MPNSNDKNFSLQFYKDDELKFFGKITKSSAIGWIAYESVSKLKGQEKKKREESKKVLLTLSSIEKDALTRELQKGSR